MHGYKYTKLSFYLDIDMRLPDTFKYCICYETAEVIVRHLSDLPLLIILIYLLLFNIFSLNNYLFQLYFVKIYILM